MSASDAARRAQATYNAAADHFDDPALSFWERFGTATVDLLDLAPGDSVLDVCAGSGASALPAARRVAPHGRVVAVDIAENLLALAGQKAQQEGLSNVVSTVHGDIDSLDLPTGHFNAVVVVFGIFFLPDMVAAAARLWDLVKPGGQLAITTWGLGLWEPATSIWWDAVGSVRPELVRAFNPWDSIVDPPGLRALFAAAGIEEPTVHEVRAEHPLSSPEEFWNVVLGSGFRATHDSLTEVQRDVVRERVVSTLAERRVSSLSANVLHAIASRR
jgi:SAM-dependent methyltransferase